MAIVVIGGLVSSTRLTLLLLPILYRRFGDPGTPRAVPVARERFRYDQQVNEYRCPGGERLTWRFRNVERGKTLDTYWSSACPGCRLKDHCTPGNQRRIRRWEHEAVLETVQARLDAQPESMRWRRQSVEHPFGTIKSGKLRNRMSNLG